MFLFFSTVLFSSSSVLFSSSAVLFSSSSTVFFFDDDDDFFEMDVFFSDLDVMVFSDVMNSFLHEVDNFLGELDGVMEVFFEVAGSFHLFKEASDFLLNLSQMDDLLNKMSDSLMGFVLNSLAFFQQVLDFLFATHKMVSQLAAFLLPEVASVFPFLDRNS